MTAARARLIPAVVGLVLALGGCGVPTDNTPRALPANEVPAELLATDPVTTSSTVPLGQTTRLRVFLIAGQGESERLVAVERTVQSPATVERVLAQLTLGPQRDEAAAGLRSAILPGTVINSVLVESGIAIIDLAKGRGISANGTDRILALAQMVYSATELREVGGVRFTVDGVRAETPNGTGVLTSGPVGRAAYATYAPI
ncbi:MAG: GerMN domain-containing protein [Acidimicrobiia bacterium]